MAGAGAIAVQANAARTLSGSAAITSGIRAEFNSDFFYKLTGFVIGKSIDNLREDKKKEMRKAQTKSYDEYTIEAAVADAISYNDGCSLIAGLQHASDAVSAEQDPGLKRLSKVMSESGFKPINGGFTLVGSNASPIPSVLNVSIPLEKMTVLDVELGKAKQHIEQISNSLGSKISAAANSALDARLKAAVSAANAQLDDPNLTKEITDLTGRYNSLMHEISLANNEASLSVARAKLVIQQAESAPVKQTLDSITRAFDVSAGNIRQGLEH